MFETLQIQSICDCEGWEFSGTAKVWVDLEKDYETGAIYPIDVEIKDINITDCEGNKIHADSLADMPDRFKQVEVNDLEEELIRNYINERKECYFI